MFCAMVCSCWCNSVLNKSTATTVSLYHQCKEYAVVDKSQFLTFCTFGCHATRCHSSFKLLISWYNFYTNLHIYTWWILLKCLWTQNFLWMKHVNANIGDPGLACKLLIMTSNKLSVFMCFEFNQICRGCLCSLKLIPQRWHELHVPPTPFTNY